MVQIGIAVCTLNQLSLDFENNCSRVLKSIKKSIEHGALIRIGPELELSGYSCEDAFFEIDTVYHSWQMLARILNEHFSNILIDVGMPVIKDSTLYNCRVIIYNSKILAIRPKVKLANIGNYRESRWFTAWGSDDETNEQRVVWFPLPVNISELTKQTFVPFGSDIVIEIPWNVAGDLSSASSALRIGFEICEELWKPDAMHVKLFTERGCHLVCNSSGSYWEIRKLNITAKLIEGATLKCGGIYAYANLLGCDGGRLCFYGRSAITVNGITQTKTTSHTDIFKDVSVAIAYTSLSEIIAYRNLNNIKIKTHLSENNVLQFNEINGYSSSQMTSQPMCSITIRIDGINLIKQNFIKQAMNLTEKSIQPEMEIFLYGSLWLWDYLSKSSMKGFIVPLSGGLDSAAVACLVYCLSILLFQAKDFDEIKFKLKSLSIDSEKITSASEICKHLLKCCYLSTRFSGKVSYNRAKNLANSIGAQFVNLNFDSIYQDVQTLVQKQQMETSTVTLLQQNLQARLRMVLTYYLSDGNRLVLATGNVDEALVGYLTKYDCSSADLNPIGSISKEDLRTFMHFFKDKVIGKDFKASVMEILDATPSAELTGHEQKDEDDIGLTYSELSVLGRVRRGEFGCYGPYGAFCTLWENISDSSKKEKLLPNVKTPEELAFKVKRFYTLHARNRHKQTVLTPSLHAVTYSPDDNRFDHRQFLFNTNWTLQFKCIDDKVGRIKETS